MINGKTVVGITQGDGNGIGYEVIIKALADARILEGFIPVVYGSSKIFGFYRKQLHNLEQVDTYVISSARDAKFKKINILNCLSDNVYVEPGKASGESARDAIKVLAAAVADLKDGLIDVLVTAPINKRTMNQEGFAYTGHTEYLQHEFGAKEHAMIMVSDELKVGVVTGHIPLSKVPSSITKEKIISKLEMMDKSLREDFGIDRPRIAVLGLNPHCGDGGLMGDEEQRVILPAVEEATEKGLLAFGPYSPDGFFGLGHYARFDATLAMYHDQGLAPFKALSFENGVNYTAGLPIVRTSPDHGTAFEMAGRDEADPRSMMSAIFTAIDIFKKRSEYARLQADKMPDFKGDEPVRNSGRPQIA